MSTVGNLRRFISERLTATAEEIFVVFEQTLIEYEKEIKRQRILLDIVWKPEVKLHRIDQHVSRDEMGLTDQQLNNQERFSSLEQVASGPPHIKDKQEGVFSSPEQEQFVPKQEEDAVPTDVAQEALSPLMDGGDGKLEEQEEEFCSPEGEQFELNQEEDAVPSDVAQEASPPLMNSGDNKPEEDPQEPAITTPPESLSTSTEPQHIKEEHDENLSSPEGEQFVPKQEEDAVPLDLAWGALPLLMDGGDSKLDEHLQEPTMMTATERSEPHNRNVWGRSCLYKSQLLKHKRHRKDTIICSVCGKTLSRGYLAVHMRSHTGERPFSCSICGKAFPYQNSFKVHMTTHTDQKPFSCSMCGKGFSSSSNFRIHVRIHTGEKPYSCSTCGMRFSEGRALKSHLRTHTWDGF